MFGIGLPELIVILVVALIVVGPEKLPELAKTVAKQVIELKRAANALKESLNETGDTSPPVTPEQFTPEGMAMQARRIAAGEKPAGDGAATQVGEDADPDLLEKEVVTTATTAPE